MKKKISINNIKYFILLALFIYICGPLFLLSNFGPGDDLFFVNQFSLGFNKDQILEFFLNKPTYFQRPISALFLSISHMILQDNFKLYVSVFFIIFSLINLLIYRSIKLLIDQNVANTYLILSLTPFLNSSYLQSPYLFSEFLLPIFFWSISIYILSISLKNNKNYLFISHIFLFLSLMCTVISFPLFSLNLFFPIIFWKDNFSFKKYFFKILLPIIFVFFVYLIYLKSITFIFNSSIYGQSLNLKSFFQGLYFFIVILIEIPIMFMESFKFTTINNLIIISFFVILFFIIFNLTNKNKLVFNKLNYKYYIFISLIALAANFFIFLFSGYPAVSFGYYNKMLISAFISLSLFLSLILNLRNSFLFFIFKIIIVIIVLNTSKVITNKIKEIEIVKKNEISILIETLGSYKNNNAILAAKLPLYLENNFNDLEIFFLTWDLKEILKNNKLFFNKTFPISNEILKIDSFNPNHNIFITKQLNSESYIYVDKKKTFQFQNKKDFMEFLESEKKLQLNINLSLRQKMRLWFKSFF